MSGGMLPRTQRRKHSFCRRVSPSCARHGNRGAAHHDKNLAGGRSPCNRSSKVKNAMSTYLRSLVGGAAGSCSQTFLYVRPWCTCGLVSLGVCVSEGVPLGYAVHSHVSKNEFESGCCVCEHDQRPFPHASLRARVLFLSLLIGRHGYALLQCLELCSVLNHVLAYCCSLCGDAKGKN